MKHDKWIALALFGVILLIGLVNRCSAQELGYGIVHHDSRADVSTSARGLEFRVNFGNMPDSDRYSSDRWSVAVGYVTERESPGDGWIDTVDGCCGYAAKFSEYHYVVFDHRWYTKPGRFKWAPQLRLWIGTGLMFRDAETCVVNPATGERKCWDGTPGVSTNFCAHQSLGIKWRERVELALREHCSTAKVSVLNTGDDYWRFSIMGYMTSKARGKRR